MITTLICCLVAFCIGTMVGAFIIALLISNKGTRYENTTSVWIAKDEKYGSHIFASKPVKRNGYWGVANGFIGILNESWPLKMFLFNGRIKNLWRWS